MSDFQVPTPRSLILGFVNTTVSKVSNFIENTKEEYRIPSKEEHYSRNNKQLEHQNSYTKKQDALDNGFYQLGYDKGLEVAESMDNYHEMGIGTPSQSGNDKLVKEDLSGDGLGSFELVYDSNDNLVINPVNMGTYNKCDASNSYIGHFIKDMLPYYLWGNSPDDPTTMSERIFGTYKYDVNATKAEAEKQRLHDTLREARIW